MSLGWVKQPIDFMGSVFGTRALIGLMNFLMWFGNTTIMLMAAIMGINPDIFEASELDGCNSRKRFFYITLPLIRPILAYTLITSIIDGLQMFDVPQILTNGQGNHDRTSMTLIMFLNSHLKSKNYTGFAIRLEELKSAPEGVDVVVTVENTGEHYSGKEVVQVYLVLPQNDMARELKRLVGFVKTDVLQPKEKKQYCIHIDRKQFTSFYEKEHAWIIDAGMYGVEIGSSINSVKPAGILHVEAPVVVEETKQLTFAEKTVNEMGAVEGAGERAEAWMQNTRKQDILIHEFVPCPEEKRVLTEEAAAEQSVEELIPLLYGNITKEASTLGMAGTCVPGSAGETARALEEKYGVRSLVMADGPAGLRLRKQYQVNRSTDQIYDGEHSVLWRTDS